MNLLNRLTIKNLKLNKKRTTVTIIGIMLSVALITAVSTLYVSAVSSLIEFETSKKGNFHVAFYNVPMKEVATLRNNRKIEELFVTKNIGYAKLENSKNDSKPYAFIKGFSKKSLNNLSIKLVDGRLPQNENEILIPTHLKTNGRIELKVSDTITLDIGKRVSNNEELNQSNPFNISNEEQIIDTKPKEYKIVGIIERPATNIEKYASPGYTFITYMDESKLAETLDVYARYTEKGLKNHMKLTANIIGVDQDIFKKTHTYNAIMDEDTLEKEMSKAKYEINENSYLIDLETNPFFNSSISGLVGVVVIVCIIIVITSIFCIKNSFDISITEKIKQYGMLRSVGATKRQIKKNVLYEAFILGIIGIPLGILSGFIASFLLVLVSNLFLQDIFDNGLNLIFTFSWISILISVVLGSITIYLSSLRSAKKASKVSPIISIRNSANIKIKTRKLKCPRFIYKIFGIGGEISYKNLKRNKKKYRTTVISIFISVSVFIALSSFMNLAFKSLEFEYSVSEYNLSLNATLYDESGLYDELLKTVDLENINNYSIYRNREFTIKNPKYSSSYIELLDIPKDDENVYDGFINITVVGDVQYRKYLKELGLDYDSTKDKGILTHKKKIEKYIEKKDKIITKNVYEFDYKKGDILTGKTSNDEEFSIEIAEVTDIKPFGLKNLVNSNLIISDELYESYFKNGDYAVVYYDSNNPNKLQDDLDEMLKGYNYNINNSEEQVKMMESLFTLIGIFLYGFITIISLIGITNIFNTITTNIFLRKREFAMFKSIGMTTKEFNKMIRLESIFMGIKSLIYGIPLGILLSYIIYIYFKGEIDITYQPPIVSIIISILSVFLLISCIMRYSMNKIRKQNTIETIRNENI